MIRLKAKCILLYQIAAQCLQVPHTVHLNLVLKNILAVYVARWILHDLPLVAATISQQVETPVQFLLTNNIEEGERIVLM